MKRLPKPIAFEWNKGNLDKNKKHGLENSEIEEVFFEVKIKVFTDHIHSGSEERFRILGKTKHGRLLFVVFTIRGKKIRVISARDINKKEVMLYEKKTNTTKV